MSKQEELLMSLKRVVLSAVLSFFLFFCLTGCETVKEGGEKGKDWDYTVVPTSDIPEDFRKEVDTKKINAFQMTYQEAEYLYLAVGYGEQASGGFNIKVVGLYEKGNTLCLETSLNGPGEDEVVSQKASYPYIVIKTQKSDKEVKFDV